MKKLFYISMAALMVLGAVSCGKDSGKKDSSGSGSKNANCYIVSEPGTYSFLAVKGNSSVSVGEVDNVYVLWESSAEMSNVVAGDIIAAVYCNLPDPGQPTTISFITQSPLQNGNALIVAVDAQNDILWSWHIWVCEGYDPSAKAQSWGGGTPKMMDRNLGATSAEPGSVGALGLMYQWGRKDPFPGAGSVSETKKAAAISTSWPNVVDNTMLCTIDYATQFAAWFIKKSTTDQDWLYDATGTEAQNRWASKKTIYDPCPAGWRVPDGGENGFWAKALGSKTVVDREYDDALHGMHFGSNNEIWLPTVGYLDFVDALPYCNGSEGYYWTCTYLPDDHQASEMFLRSTGRIDPASTSEAAYGGAVRCCKE
ncbi:MAG: hypothetical protein J5771_07460 [Bacteroidales bacterium]|nr:hypothetical protein [Bacteroidales bacterium]